MKTRDRILQAALEMFNDQGERKVSTNHLAAHMDMSPGNLYYHFKNKQEIIYELFLQYEERVDEILEVPSDRQLTVEDKVNYLRNVFQGIWEFRFIHRDMEHLLMSEQRLHARYRDFFRRCQLKTQAIYQGLNDAGIISLDGQAVEGLALNTWIVVTSWYSFLQCNLLLGPLPRTWCRVVFTRSSSWSDLTSQKNTRSRSKLCKKHLYLSLTGYDRQELYSKWLLV